MIAFLDTTPTGGITNPKPKSQQVHQIQAWAEQMVAAGHQLVVPAVVDYELRREHLLRGATASIASLDAFINRVPGRYMPVTDSALKRAAELWADIRKKGLPTADLKELDCDILLAAQVLDLNLAAGSFIVVTGNVRHISRMVDCDIWQNVVP